MFLELKRLTSNKNVQRIIFLSVIFVLISYSFSILGKSVLLSGKEKPAKLREISLRSANNSKQIISTHPELFTSSKEGLGDTLRFTENVPDNTDKVYQDRVREMARHAWGGYKKYAWGDDELLPLSNRGRNWTDASYLFTPVDSLDTLFIMGLEKEYREAKELVIQKLDIDQPNSQSHNHFEIVIRVLGGLLSAYDLDPDTQYLKIAIKVADRLLVALDSPSGLPSQYINVQTGKNHGSACMASVGTIQLEFQYMSDLTGDPKYQKKALAIYGILEKMNEKFIPGLYTSSLTISNPPHFVNINHSTGKPNRYGVGSEIDSFYEYLLKMYISTKEERFGLMYDQSRDAIIKHLLKTYNTSVLLPDLTGNNHANSFEHLACFTGGMLTLGSKVRKADNQSSRHFEIGKAITETCQRSYQESRNGLGGESFSVSSGGSTRIENQSIYLRPEVIESVFYLYRFTKDQKYRDFGVNMINSLNMFSKTESGYSALYSNSKTDKMESFFMAETLKYLYLLFSDDSVIPLDQYVLNTEAHPISVRGFGRRKDPKKWVPL